MRAGQHERLARQRAPPTAAGPLRGSAAPARAGPRSGRACARRASWAGIEAAIFSPTPGSRRSAPARRPAARRCRGSRCARLRAVTSPTSSIPSANSTRAKGRCLEASIAASRFARGDLAEALELQELLLASGGRSPPPSCTRPCSCSSATCFSPSPSMSIAPRETKCLSSCQRAGAVAVGALREDALLGLDRLRVAERAARRRRGCGGRSLRSTTCGAGETTCGITSPARTTITSSPARMSLRRMSSSLCSVASLIVTPPTAPARAPRTGAGRRTCRRSTSPARASSQRSSAGTSTRPPSAGRARPIPAGAAARGRRP